MRHHLHELDDSRPAVRDLAADGDSYAPRALTSISYLEHDLQGGVAAGEARART